MNKQFHHLSILVASILLTLGGCSSRMHPGVWSEEEVEIRIQNKMGLEQLDLQQGGDGLIGSGSNAEGETFQIEVKQDVAGKRMDYIAKGDRGTNEEGFFETE
jgi:hypothetical protein